MASKENIKKRKREQTQPTDKEEPVTKKLKVSENWLKLQKTIPKNTWKKKKRVAVKEQTRSTDINSKRTKEKCTTTQLEVKETAEYSKKKGNLTRVIAMDCEMVGIGPEGKHSSLARVTIVNSFGDVLYDKFVKSREPVTDYRTKYSGILPHHLEDASDFLVVQREVATIIQGRIVVGHGLENDFRALMLSHPFRLTRDTAKFVPLQKSKGRPHKLKTLALKVLSLNIQDHSHDPAEDARTALLLYKHLKKDWERFLKTQVPRKKKSSKVHTAISSMDELNT
eukprot:TRINITY_DN1988_c0_g3_i1.p1 TRINITY_DN1988_c0_g3~~TRINITY_DN1988_c0_g3_i1.p1  ORF type:complete len:282 (-),score=50.53 TRINITY_DN1988_c0_g3_i1:26-871(-)